MEAGTTVAGASGKFDLRSGQLLEEDAGLEHAERVQVALIEQVIVIGVLGLQRRVADGKRDRAGRLVFGHIGDQLAGSDERCRGYRPHAAPSYW